MKKIFFILAMFGCLFLQAEIIIEESFDAVALPAGWTQQYVSGNISWMTYVGGNNGYPAAPHSGARNAYIFAENCTTKLITPMLNIGGSTNATLSFWRAHAAWSGHQDELKIYYKTEPNGNWVLIETYNNNQTTWVQTTINLPSESSSYFIAFEAVCDWGRGVVIDDVVVEGVPSAVGVVEGHVYNANGIPLTGAEVVIEDVNMSALTQPGGFYQIVAVPEGVHPFFASLDGYGFDMTTANVIAGEVTTVNFNLQEYIEVMVSGTVTTVHGGTPIQGATITLEGFSNYQTQTAANGQFIISGVYSDNSYELTVTKPNHNPHTEMITIEESNYNCGTITLYAPVQVNGWVNTTGSPEAGLEGAQVSLTGYAVHNVETDEDGNFVIENIYANENYNLTITYDNHNPWEQLVQVAGLDIDLGTLTLISPVTIIGDVATNIEPEEGLGGAQITLTGYATHNVQSAANGQFLIFGVYANQTYQINVTYPNHNPYLANINVGQENLELGTLILIAPVSLSGMVVSNMDPETGLDNAVINLTGYANHSTSTDSLGNFLIEEIYANENYSLSVNYPDHNIYQQTISITDEDLDLGTIELIGPINISGYVYGSDDLDHGLVGSSVSLSGYATHSTITDSLGYFEFNEVFANQAYTIAVSADGYNQYQGTVNVASANLELSDIILEETTLPAGNVNAQLLDENTASVSWNVPGGGSNYEFRYDDGVPVTPIGLSGLRAVLGAAHRNYAIINQVQWYLTNAHSHPNVQVYIFGLNSNGTPNSNNLLYQSTLISNQNNQWRTHNLPNPIVAPTGFLVGVCTPNVWTDVAMDDGDHEPWVFESGTQYSTSDHQGGVWNDISAHPSAGNLLIRAYGINLGPPVGRELEGYKIFRMKASNMPNPNTWELLAENLQDTTYVDSTFWHLDQGTWHYGIRCQHTNGVESAATFSNGLIKSAPPTFTVTLHITNSGGDPLQYCITSLSGFHHTYNANSNVQGIATYASVNPGVYDLRIQRTGYDEYRIYDMLIEEDIELEIVLESAGSNETDISGVTSITGIYPNPFNPRTELSFELIEESHVVIEVYNSKGQKVADLLDKELPSGEHSCTWDANEQASGIYFVKFRAGSITQLRKALLLK
jgi:hypothetical protein